MLPPCAEKGKAEESCSPACRRRIAIEAYCDNNMVPMATRQEGGPGWLAATQSQVSARRLRFLEKQRCKMPAMAT